MSPDVVWYGNRCQRELPRNGLCDRSQLLQALDTSWPGRQKFMPKVEGGGRETCLYTESHS